MTEPGKDIVKWADEAMFEAQPIAKGKRGGPQVFLLSATSDPLGALAAGFRMYRGDPPYSLHDISDEERKWAWDESLKTHLKAPWEMIDFMFLLEGVSRAFTHQLVRQRTAVYAQESLRFAVKRDVVDEAYIPPSIRGNEQAELLYFKSIRYAEGYYNALVDAGIPAEDARALLPHATTTRVIYKTNFRGLMEHAGNRLCTQAQFEWRSVFLGIMNAIRSYNSEYYRALPEEAPEFYEVEQADWQWELIATPIAQTFAPVCYKVGHCVFMGKLDRGCTIRDRVTAFAEAGIPAQDWGRSSTTYKGLKTIMPEEWMADPMAGVTDEYNRRPNE